MPRILPRESSRDAMAAVIAYEQSSAADWEVVFHVLSLLSE